MMKAGALGRLGDVTKLLQTQLIDSRWCMQGFLSMGEPSLPFLSSPRGWRFGGMIPGNFWKSAVSQLPAKNCCAAAMGKIWCVDESDE